MPESHWRMSWIPVRELSTTCSDSHLKLNMRCLSDWAIVWPLGALREGACI